VDQPKTVAFEDHPFEWNYDATLRNLFVRVSVKAGEDNVIHISF
jgi:hypothetical protein